MSYISGARSVADKQVRIASTKIDGIGPKKAIQVRYRLGISGNIKIKELTKYQIDQIEQMIDQDHIVHWELKRGERAPVVALVQVPAPEKVVVYFPSGKSLVGKPRPVPYVSGNLRSG